MVKAELKDYILTIKIKNILHLKTKFNKTTSIQSWIEGYKEPKYIIEYDNCTRCEYDNKDLWKEILIQIDKLHNSI